MRRLIQCALGACLGLGLTLSGACWAQAAFPSKTLREVVPYGPGGAADALGRMVAERLSRSLGQQVLVDNVAGAGTVLGVEAVAKAPADGHTLLLASFASFVSNPIMSNGLSYDVDRDFEGVSLLATTPMVLVVSNQLNVKSVKELVDYARANPGRLSFGTSGSGSTVHLAAELFKVHTGVDMVHVPYKSSAEVLNALVGGHIQLAFDIVLSAKPLIDAGKVRAVAVSDTTRSSLLSGIPTVAESGYPDFAANTWYGLAVRKGTPRAAIDRLHASVAQIVLDPELQKRFSALAMDLRSSTPEGLMDLANKDRKRWGRIVSSQGIKADK